ncbi:MAG: DUF2461 domain-containing protein [Clostridiales bacterium]|jgi:uncharacterized protein (DUF2461 family)|nr:DUF2461 domain-containing protein [Clostridiales bacterium]
MKQYMPEPEHFNGFQKEFVDFLFSLRFRNTIDLLQENKSAYKTLITGPLTLLFNDLSQIALSVSDTLVVKPSKCVSAMYSDMRFSRSKPLKEYMYIRFREPSQEHDILGLYFDMGSDGYSYGIRIYNQTSVGMEKIRKGILARSCDYGRELVRLKYLGMMITGGKYAKDHYPDIDDAVIKELMNMKFCHFCWDQMIDKAVFSRELFDKISNAYNELQLLFTLLKQSLNTV